MNGPKKLTLDRALADSMFALYVQGRASLCLSGGDPLITCAYRGQRGTACAIGWLIPNRLYSPVLEGQQVWSKQMIGIMREVIDDPDLEFLDALQWAHDSTVEYGTPRYDTKRDFRLALRRRSADLARGFRLRDPLLNWRLPDREV